MRFYKYLKESTHSLEIPSFVVGGTSNFLDLNPDQMKDVINTAHKIQSGLELHGWIFDKDRQKKFGHKFYDLEHVQQKLI